MEVGATQIYYFCKPETEVMKKLIFLTFILLFKVGLSQLTEEFSDGNFTFQPNWIGTDTKFIINTSYQLQLKSKDTVSSSAHLATLHQLSSIENMEWRVWVKQSFSPSGNNYSKIYLTADNEQLNNLTSGYYLQLGEAGSGDAIRLFKTQKQEFGLCIQITTEARIFNLKQVLKIQVSYWELIWG